MEGKPAASQRRHQVGNLFRLQRREAEQQESHGHSDHAQPVRLHSRPKDHQQQRHAPGKGCSELKLIAQRQSFCHDPSHDQIDRVGKQPREKNIPGRFPDFFLFKSQRCKLQRHGRKIENQAPKEQDIHLETPLSSDISIHSCRRRRMPSGLGPPTAAPSPSTRTRTGWQKKVT